MQGSICTIGYEGTEIEEFIAALKEADIEIILDIREEPLSRKIGFSKNHLAKSLRENNIGYVHLQGLGNPKAGRAAGKRGDNVGWRQIYSSHLQSKIARDDMMTAIQIAKQQRACFLCFERNPEECHRSITVQDLAERTKQRVDHLLVPKDKDQYAMFQVEED